MIDFQWIWGLVFGLETSTIYVIEEGEKVTEENECVVYSLHLGVFTIILIV